MSVELSALVVDATDPRRLATFWAGLLGWTQVDETLFPTDDTGFGLRFAPTDQPKVGPNRVHLHLTSTSLEDQQATVDTALELGGSHLDVGQRPEEGHLVLADPEGNEFCVIEPGNRFLAGCGFLGELACDGTRAVGLFWAAALGWPLVWDHDEETAIQALHGGPKVAWGGPPVAPKLGKNRMRFELVAEDVEGETARLIDLGARREGDDLVDPDGNEFGVVPSAV